MKYATISGMKTTIIAILIAVACGAFFPLFGSDQRNTPITVNLIVDGSQALSGVINDVSSTITKNLVDGILQTGDRLTIWSAGKAAQILYSETLQTSNDIENIKKTLKNLPAQGDVADFSAALRDVAARKSGQNIYYTMLVSASPALPGTNPQLLRFSRVEEHAGWRLLVIAPDINERVRQAAVAFFSGN